MSDWTYRQGVLRACDAEGQRVMVSVTGAIGRGGRMVPLKPQPGGAFPPGIHEYLRQRDGDDCYLCQRPLSGRLQVDHVQASHVGGEHARYNWQLTHAECNNVKNGHMNHDALHYSVNEFGQGQFMERHLRLPSGRFITIPVGVSRRYATGTAQCADAGRLARWHCIHNDVRPAFCHCESPAWAARQMSLELAA